MFGQPQNSPFGSPQPAGGFGATNTTPAFGSPAPAPFGAPAPAFGGGGFGSPAPAPGGFGAPAPATGGFGQPSTFGGASAFGGGGGGGGFGAPAPAPTGFGGFGSAQNASPFGAAPAPSGGLFGAPAPAPTGGLFGSSGSTNPGFGGTSSGFGGGGFGGAPSGGFGAQTQSSTFGSPAPSTGMFGAPAPAPTFGSTGGFGGGSSFGAPAPPPGGSIFGAPAAAPSTGLFGSPPGGQPAQSGTKNIPFQATNRQDGTSTITMQSISAMDPYQNKNFEELRFEDYSQGNRGTGQGGAPAPAGGFGFGSAPAPTGGGLFGSPSPAPFGSPAPSPFGAPAPAPFGAPAPGAFGSPSPASFGAPAQGAFGAPGPAPFAAPAPSTGGFGSSFGKPASGGLFGAPAPGPTGGFFGSSPSPAPAFGAPAPSGGLFGSTPAPAPPGGLFGAPPAPSGGFFGSTPAPAPFGAPAPAPGGFGFGSAPAPSGGLFGAPSPAPGGFGAPAPTGLFGSPAPAPGTNLFGGPGSSSLFGAPAPAPAGGFFGSPAPAPGGALFGAQQPAPAPAALPPAGSIIPPAANEVLAHQIQALENKRQEMQKLHAWREKSPEESSIVPVSQPEYDGRMSNSILTSSSQYSPYRQSPRSSAKIRPRGFGAGISPAPSSSAPSALNNIGAGGRPMMSPDAYAASSVKRLVIKPGSLTPKPKMRLRLGNNVSSNVDSNTHALPVPLDTATPSRLDAGSKVSPIQTPNGKPSAIPVYGRRDAQKESQGKSPAQNEAQMIAIKDSSRSPLEDITTPPDPVMDYYQKVIASPDGVPANNQSSATSGSAQKKRPAYVPKLTKHGYVVTPSLDRLASMSEADLASVSGFSVRHDPYGVVEWEGAVDVRYADLDKSIDIGQSDVSVYLRDEEEGEKPEVGSKLNRPARITFYSVFPKNGGSDADEETKDKFAKRIAKSTTKMDSAELISYNKDTGEWKIRVQHFSRYGLDDDTDEEESSSHMQQNTPEKHDIDVDPWQGDEDGMDDAAVVSDIEMEKDSVQAVLKDSEAAYYALFQQPRPMAVESPAELLFEDKVLDTFEEEGEEPEEDEGGTRFGNVAKENYQEASRVHAGSGICSRLASKAFAGERRPPSSTDCYKMLRTFGVTWSPNGSFVKVDNGSGNLVRCRPVFNEEAGTSDISGKYLATHNSHATKIPTSVDDRSPRFVLPMAMGNTGDSSSHSMLRKALDDYSESASRGNSSIGSLVFALLACLVDNPESVERSEFDLSDQGRTGTMRFLFSARRKEATLRFLVNACKKSVHADVQAARAQNDSYGAIFVALTGGDLAKACEVAAEIGKEDLAACISAFDVEGNEDIVEQLRLALDNPNNIPEKLMRIYNVLSGDLKHEEKLFSAGKSSLDWMRRLIMHLLFCNPKRPDSDISEVLVAYDENVRSGVAPFPKPHYHGPSDGIESVLYRLLRLTETPQKISCIEAIDPVACSKSRHDFNLSFHLASVLSSAMGICPSPEEEERLIFGYAAQLLACRRWEWAVYICLCSLSRDALDSSSTDWKRRKAKELVLQNFNMEDPDSGLKRTFLVEKVGIPKEWLHEALATRCANDPGGDPFDYITHLASFSPPQASAVVDEVIVPNLLFMNRIAREKALGVLDLFQEELSPLSAAILNLFELTNDVSEIIAAPGENASEQLREMFEVCQEIDRTLSSCREKDFKTNHATTRSLPSFEVIPVSAMLHEAFEHLELLRLQLKAIEKGIHIDVDVARKKLKSQLAFLTMDEYNEAFQGPNIVRGLR